MDLAAITVKHMPGEGLEIRVRGLQVNSDYPLRLDEDDGGPTPTELMVAGLAACAADEAANRLAHSGERADGTEVAADVEWDLDTGRISSIQLSITLPDGISEVTRHGVLRAIRRCPALKLLTEPPIVEYAISGGVAMLAGPGRNGSS
jgi:uncharacterized OsmC-like protein